VVTGLVAFYDERVDVVLDGERRRAAAAPRCRRRSWTRPGSPANRIVAVRRRRAVGLRAAAAEDGIVLGARRSTGCASRATSASSGWRRPAATRRSSGR
jgi:hypothetical protein